MLKQDDFSTKTQVQHVFEIPDMYVGNVVSSPTTFYGFNRGIISPMVCGTSPGILRLVLEVLSNSGDAICQTRKTSPDVGSIELFTTRKTIRVVNGGFPIPVEPHLKSSNELGTTVLIPDLIFGRMLSSSNYDKERSGCGRNGLGVKLVNIFSERFVVEVGDSVTGHHYRGEWKGPMLQETTSVCIPGYGDDLKPRDGAKYVGPNYVSVEFDLWFPRFGKTEFTDEELCLFQKCAIDFSLTCKVPVSLNGVSMYLGNISKYASLIFSESVVASAIVFRAWDSGRHSFDPDTVPGLNADIPCLEVMLLDTPDESRVFSFANGLMTPEGGVHVKAVYDKITPLILAIAMKGVAKDDCTLKPADIKPHISMIIVSRVKNPIYPSQSKEQLSSCDGSIPVSGIDVRNVSTWNLMDRLKNALQERQHKILSKTDGKRTVNVKIAKGEDANLAGGPKSLDCTLFLTEGDSAAGYIQKRIQHSGGKDLFGYLPLQGKFMNIDGASATQLVENKEYIAIKQMLGLQEGADYAASPGKLRYGKVVIATDADADGKHIMGLLLFLFSRKWPSLIETKRIAYLLTPSVRITQQGKTVFKFFDDQEYEKAMKITPLPAGMKAVYYKGLGRSEEEEIVEDLHHESRGIVTYDYSTGSQESLELLFSMSSAQQRKEWMRQGSTEERTAELLSDDASLLRRVPNFIDVDMLNFCKVNLFRGIPCYRDTLKKSIRQILFWVLTHWKYGKATGCSDKANGMKLEQMAGRITGELEYHHGSQSLVNAIIGLGQSFVGSNNLPIIKGIGNYGTRDKMGKDSASGRYIAALPAPWLTHAINRAVVEVIPRRIVEGKEVEPSWIPIDIPIGIINGWSGIATGWSTLIPPHDPVDIINWILKKSENPETTPKAPMPCFRGFKGVTEIVKSRKRSQIIQESPEEDVGDQEVIVGERMLTHGSFKTIAVQQMGGKVVSYDIEITELPVGKAFHTYRKWLEGLREDKELTSIADKGDTVNVHLIVKGLKFEPSHQSLGLSTSYSLTNIVCIDEGGSPAKLSVESLLNHYYGSMIEAYTSMRIKLIGSLEHDLRVAENKALFLSLVVSGKVVIQKRPKTEIESDLKMNGVDTTFDHLSTPMSSLTIEGINRAKELIAKLTSSLNELKATPAVELWMRRLRDLLEVDGIRQ